MALQFIHVLTFAFFLSISNGKISPSLRQKFLDGGLGQVQNIMVSFSQSLDPVYAQIKGTNSSDDEHREALVAGLQSFTEGIQAPLREALEGQGVNSESFWISNSMSVQNASELVAQFISNFPGVESVEEEQNFELEAAPKMGPAIKSSKQGYLTWGVQRIRADKAWNAGYTGRNVVVGVIDTGVRYTHEALRNRWRQTYGWYDPYRRTRVPEDDQGHGSHTTGTVVGDNGIGVAPGASWVHCKGCNRNGCDERALLACGQWMLCPTDTNGQNQNCGYAPKIVSNSWGSPGNNNFYDNIIRAWRDAGIIPVFANGNHGPNCGTSGSPGQRPGVISVGNTDTNERINSQSSLGPAADGSLKPDISGPGTDVISAYPSGDNHYKAESGTSMACPHVSGVIALMLEKNPNLNYNQIYNAIAGTTFKQMDTSTAYTCGGIPPNRYPNHVFGYGRIDALNSVNAV